MSNYKSKLGNLWTYRELLKQLTIRNVELRHRGSHLGIFWSIISPLILLVLYVVVFGYIFQGKFGARADESRLDYALALFVGLTLFHFVAEIIATAPTLILSNPNFVKKVVFPLDILPVATVGSAALHAGITLSLALIGVAVWGTGISQTWLWLPLILLPVLLLALGLAWLLSALGVFFRDLAQMSQFMTMVLMFSSAIFYPTSSIPPAIWSGLKFNPLIHAVELARDIIVWHVAPSSFSLIYLNTCAFAAVGVGFFVFRGLRDAFADVV